MKKNNYFVFETNVIVSALLFPDSSVAKAFNIGLLFGTIIISEETLEELQEVLLRNKLDKYLLKSIRQAFLQKFEIIAEMIEITETSTVCRDQKDDSEFRCFAFSKK
jgi:putative PIN family toxin of toxin-antitoxin system